ncbi:MAG: flavodoxin family protein [Promethearchaeota archaeon]
MKVIAINGSARGAKGNTRQSLDKLASYLENEGIEVEIIDLSEKKLNPCNACNACKGKNKCIQDDDVNEIYSKLVNADGIVLASPTYFSNVTSRMQMLIERTGTMARGNGNTLKNKVGAAIAVARRAGINFVYAALNYYFGIAQMPIATSTYWNNVIAGPPGQAENDNEGMETIKHLGETLANMLKKLR